MPTVCQVKTRIDLVIYDISDDDEPGGYITYCCQQESQETDSVGSRLLRGVS